MARVAVIGGGAAGMMAALTAAGRGHQADLYEKNEKLGKKIYITGKGRCNLTNSCEIEEFPGNVVSGGKFLLSSLHAFSNHDTMAFFEEEGLRIKTERGERVFPASDHASDVISVLKKGMEKRGVSVHLNTLVSRVITDEDPEAKSRSVKGIELENGIFRQADAVIVCTGGLSYPSTGSTGDGYRFASEAGHKVTECIPSLVPLETKEDDPARMQGLSLKNVRLTLKDGKKTLYEGFGEMMFTHFGVTGPLVLSASAAAGRRIAGGSCTMLIDLKPALSEEQLNARFLREFDQAKNKEIKNVLGAVYPAAMVPVVLDRAQIPPERKVHDVSRKDRMALIDVTRHFSLSVTGTRGFSEAVITKGGVSLKEIRPDTMESKLVRGLFFAGEVLDADAMTGGFNLQIAWSTGRAAGMGIS